jgi:Xaa-Pro aminopeptidase
MFAGRLARTRVEMAKKKLAAYLITSRKDGYYLTGFTGEDSAVLITPRRVFVVSDSRFDEAIDQECPWVTKLMRKGTLEDAVGKLLRRLKLGAVAVQTDHVTLQMQQALRKAASPTRFVKAPKIVNRLRTCKDAGELDTISQAIKIAQDAFKATCRSIRPGQTEKQIAARLEYEMQKRGSSGAAFPTIVAEGPNASLPHACPGMRKVKRGSAILFDWGAIYRFYCSDLTRVVFVGRIPPRIRRLYGVALEAKERATAAIRPGARMCDVDAIARGHIKKAGFGKYFGHGLGHGLGLAVHEPPSLSWRSQEKLEAGMVVTVEPGIYIPGAGGVRIEDDVLVTPDGHRVLSSLSTDLADAVL